MNRPTGYTSLRTLAGLTYMNGKWFLRFGNEYIPLDKVTGPLKKGLMKAAGHLKANAARMALPAAALTAGIVIGCLIGSRGKRQEQEARLEAEFAKETLLREQEELLQTHEELAAQFERYSSSIVFLRVVKVKRCADGS